jgi:hypothetical protein
VREKWYTGLLNTMYIDIDERKQALDKADIALARER